MPIKRFLTAVALLPVFVAALWFLPALWWVLLLLAILLVASHEWAALSGFSRSGAWMFTGLIVASAVALSVPHAAGRTTLPQIWVLWVATGFWLAVVPAWLALRARIRHRVLLVATGWAVLVPTHVALAVLQPAPEVLLMLMGVVWIADSAAYFAGRAIGRIRLAPAISPGKTWEGVAGAVLAVTVYYAVLYVLFSPQQPLLSGIGGLVLFAIVTMLSIEGDLFESWVKRQAGAKDSGTLLPGHGGVLDRIDGLTASMPLAALWCNASGVSTVY